MAGKTDTSATLFAQKKLLGKAHTSNLKIDGEEVIGSNIQTATSLIFGDPIPNSPSLDLYTVQSASLNSQPSVEYIQFVLNVLTGTTYDANDTGGGSGSDTGETSQTAGPHAYKFRLPSNYQSLTNNSRSGNGVFNNNKLVHETLGQLQLVQPFFSQDAPNPYIVKIYKDDGAGGVGDEIPLLDNIDWNVDYYNGILFIQDYSATKIPAFARAFAYVGRMAEEVISSGSSGGGGGGGGGGGSGDSNASYLVLSSTGSLSNERVFSTGTGLTSTDGGAGSSYTLQINDSVVATLSGATFQGAVTFNQGISGSLTRLSNGSPYLIAGSNVTIVTGSSGAVTISATTSGGGGSSSTIIQTSWMEEPTGDVDSMNMVYTLAHTPSPSSALLLYVNGILQRGNGDDYSLSGNSFVMNYAPQAGSSLTATYPYETVLATSTKWFEVPSGDVDGSNYTFVLESSPVPSGSLMLYVNGVLQRQGPSYDYTLSGNTITMNYTPNNSSNLAATYPY
jgi:hypothetical protein